MMPPTPFVFDKIPLVNVEVAFLLSEAWSPTLDEVVRLSTILKPNLPSMTDLWIPEVSSAMFPSVLTPGFSLSNTSHLRLDVRAPHIAVSWWSNGHDDYVTFDNLKNLIFQVVDVVRLKISVARITYNVVQSLSGGENGWDFVNSDFYPSSVKGDTITHEAMANYRGDEFVDFRYHITAVNEQLQITTTGGKFLNSEDPRLVLEQVHSSMKLEFSKLISDVAKERWGFHAASN